MATRSIIGKIIYALSGLDRTEPTTNFQSAIISSLYTIYTLLWPLRLGLVRMKHFFITAEAQSFLRNTIRRYTVHGVGSLTLPKLAGFELGWRHVCIC